MITFFYYNKNIIAAAFLVLLVLLLSSCSVYASVQEASTTIPICGNNIQESDEQCDGLDLNGASCVSQGFTGGTLSCAPLCTFNTSSCTSGGGGGGGGGGSVLSPVTSVIFSGRAYPASAVTLLKDAQIATTTVAGADANFQISISGLSGGNYIFSLYSEDKAGRRSSLLTFQVSVTQGAITNVTGIFIAPTIAVDKSEVKRGDNIAIFGQSVPHADIVILVNSEEDFFARTISDNGGIYLYNFDTSVLEYGAHSTKSKASVGNQIISSFSYLVVFDVGTKTVEKDDAGCGRADLNCDGRVNLVDFSIAAFWYKRNISAEFAVKESAQLNGDGKSDLVDFSIIAYYWTG